MYDLRVLIYGLVDPREPGRIRYVGKTAKIDKRLKQHRAYASDKPRTKLQKWLMSRRRDGIVIDAVILEDDIATESELDTAEIDWIAHYGLENLVNGTRGGTGGVTWLGPHTPETLARMKASHAARSERMRAEGWEPKTYVKKGRADQTTPEARAKMSAALTGQVRSDEAKANYRASWTPERRAAHGEKVRQSYVQRRENGIL